MALPTFSAERFLSPEACVYSLEDMDRKISKDSDPWVEF